MRRMPRSRLDLVSEVTLVSVNDPVRPQYCSGELLGSPPRKGSVGRRFERVRALFRLGAGFGSAQWCVVWWIRAVAREKAGRFEGGRYYDVVRRKTDRQQSGRLHIRSASQETRRDEVLVKVVRSLVRRLKPARLPSVNNLSYSTRDDGNGNDAQKSWTILPLILHLFGSRRTEQAGRKLEGEST